MGTLGLTLNPTLPHRRGTEQEEMRREEEQQSKEPKEGREGAGKTSASCRPPTCSGSAATVDCSTGPPGPDNPWLATRGTLEKEGTVRESPTTTSQFFSSPLAPGG